MSGLSEAVRARLAEIAARHGVKPETAEQLLEALRGGGGKRARFDVPELGGAGQWACDGPVIIGDMLDTDRKARIDALCRELARLVTTPGIASPEDPRADPETGGGWPAWPGLATAGGGQNDMRYAVFPGRRRLAVARGEAMTVHCIGQRATGGASRPDRTTPADPGGSRSAGDDDHSRDHSLGGPGSASAGAGKPATEERAGRKAAAVTSSPLADPVVLIERLAELYARGILTDEEFARKKAELLSRL
jgi:hypothetical protein